VSSGKKIDEMNEKIIRALQKDARTNFSEVAKNCGVSLDTIIKRLNRMKMSGIVRGTTVLLDPRSLGFDCLASLEIDVEYPHVIEMVEAIRTRPEVIFCTPSMGRHSIFAIAFLKNVDKLNQLKESIKGNPLVRGVNTSIWVDEFLSCPENFEFKTA